MKTRITVTIESETAKICFGYLDPATEEFEFVESVTPEALEILGCSPELLDSLISLTADIRDSVKEDLLSIWRRLDQIEDRLSEVQARGRE